MRREQLVPGAPPHLVRVRRVGVGADGGVQLGDAAPPVEELERLVHRSMSPTTKNIEASTVTRSATRVPGSTATSADTLLNDAVRIASRHGVVWPRETRK